MFDPKPVEGMAEERHEDQIQGLHAKKNEDKLSTRNGAGGHKKVVAWGQKKSTGAL